MSDEIEHLQSESNGDKWSWEVQMELQAKVNELQDRVDTALALIDTSSYAEIERRLPDFIDQLKEALRGQNDSR